MTPTPAIADCRHPLSSVVMAGLVPAIHAVNPPLGKTEGRIPRRVSPKSCAGLAAWMAGTSPAMTA
jgi:hypothetical protein